MIQCNTRTKYIVLAVYSHPYKTVILNRLRILQGTCALLVSFQYLKKKEKLPPSRIEVRNVSQCWLQHLCVRVQDFSV